MTETVFSDVAPGTYTLTITLSSPEGGTPLGACGEIEYPHNVPVPHGIVEFFLESFEESTGGSVIEDETVAHSGERYYQGDYTVTYARPNARDYVIEYFYLESGKWVHIRKAYETNSMVLSEGQALDDIRIYPSDALMTTFTYNPLYGVTSRTDPNCITTSYDYDGMGRLVRLRDHEGNVLKSYSYHYKADQ